MYVTPCINVCVIDKNTNICEGCKRTSAQISNWTLYSNTERMEIMLQLGYGKRTSREERLRRYDRG